MADVNRINISLLHSYENDFLKEYKRFISKTYATFKSSYLNNCSDSYVFRMNRSLDNLYTKIKKSYNNIDKWWQDYNSDVYYLERSLAGNGSPGKIKEASVRNIVYNLPELKEYNIKYSGVLSTDIITGTYETSLLNDTVYTNVNSFKDVGTLVGKSVKNAFYDILDIGYSITDWFEYTFKPWQEKATQKVWSVIKSVGATVAVAVQSLVEGVLEFGEAIADFLALAGTAVATVVTGLIDLGQAINGLISGDEWSSLTKKMWNATKGVVAEKYVTGWFDSLYENTGYGKWLTENAYGMDITRSIASGIGYVAGVVVLTIATAGVGGVAAGGSAAASTVTSTQMAATAATAGVGKGTQNAWADGAGTVEGLATGTLTGIWEGIQYFLGAKISKFSLKNIPEKNIINSLARVTLDGLDGGVEGFVMPLINSIYKDGYYDEDGNYVEFLESDNFKTKYEEIFDDNGGWSAVLTNAVVGAGSSILGESFDIGKYIKDKKNTANVKISEQEIQLKMDRYNELLDIKNSKDYLAYIDNIKKGYAQELKIEFESIEKELNALEEELTLIAGIISDADVDISKIKNDVESKKNANNTSNVSTTSGVFNKSTAHLSFSKEYAESIKQLSDYYGDAGQSINNMFLQGKNAKQIFDELDGQDKIEFQKFLQNTRQGQYLASLSDTEIRSMTTYTGGSYTEINDMLRRENISGTINGVDAQELINSMDMAISKYGGLEASTEIYRAVGVSAFMSQNSSYAALFKGIDINDLNQVYSVLKVLEGKKFGDLGYMSTSPAYSASFAKYQWCPIVLDIIADEGTQGAYINQISNFYNSENEFLLARNTALQMVEVLAPEKDINGLEKIIVKCVVK